MYIQEGFPESIKSFKEHLKRSVNRMLDDFDKGNDYDDKYDLQLVHNGGMLTLDMHADLFDRLCRFLDEELEEYVELQTRRVDNDC